MTSRTVAGRNFASVRCVCGNAMKPIADSTAYQIWHCEVATCQRVAISGKATHVIHWYLPESPIPPSP